MTGTSVQTKALAEEAALAKLANLDAVKLSKKRYCLLHTNNNSLRSCEAGTKAYISYHCGVKASASIDFEELAATRALTISVYVQRAAVIGRIRCWHVR